MPKDQSCFCSFLVNTGRFLPFRNQSLEEKKCSYCSYFFCLVIINNPCPLCKSISLGCSLCTLILCNCKLSGMSLLIKEDSLLAREGQHFVQKQADRLLHFSKEREKKTPKPKKEKKSRTEVWKVSKQSLPAFSKVWSSTWEILTREWREKNQNQPKCPHLGILKTFTNCHKTCIRLLHES